MDRLKEQLKQLLRLYDKTKDAGVINEIDSLLLWMDEVRNVR